MFSYKMRKSKIASLMQASDEDLIKMEASKAEYLKNFVMGPEGNRFSVNLLDDSNQTPEDPDGLASCNN
jgi:Ulp1 family protease